MEKGGFRQVPENPCIRMEVSAGILFFSGFPVSDREEESIQVLLGFPGGPFFRKRQTERLWSIPKGRVEPPDDAVQTAVREACEETGFIVSGPLYPLGDIYYSSRRKKVIAWAYWTGSQPPPTPKSSPSTVEMIWKGRTYHFPELDPLRWFPWTEARQRILPAQEPFLDRLITLLKRWKFPPALAISCRKEVVDVLASDEVFPSPSD